MVIESPVEDYPLEQSFRSWKILSNDISKSKIGFAVEKLLKFNI